MQHAFGFEQYIDSIAKHIEEHFQKVDEAFKTCEDLKASQKGDAVLKSQKQEILKLAYDCNYYRRLESLSIGIFGEWGSGKTKLLKGIENKFNNNDKIIPVFFNAWRYEKNKHIIIPLFKTLQHKVKEVVGTDEKRANLLEDLRILTFSLLSGFSAEFAGLKFEANPAIERFFKMQKAGEKEIDEFEMMERIESVYYNIPQKIEAITLSHDIRFLFLIDDLDRCLPENALKMLESIKLFLDIPGCTFVLAIDDDIVERGVAYHYKDYLAKERESTPPITGSEYLEKMIQVPFTLPVLHDTQVESFLHERYPDLFDERMLALFATLVVSMPRKIIRVVELFKLKKTLLPDIQDDDLLKLVCLELFTPTLFREAKREYPKLPVFYILGVWKEGEESSLYDFEKLKSFTEDNKLSPKIKDKHTNVLNIMKKENNSRVNFDLDSVFDVPIREESIKKYLYIQEITEKTAKAKATLYEAQYSDLIQNLQSEAPSNWKLALDELEGKVLDESESEKILQLIEAKEIKVTSKWLLTIYPNLSEKYFNKMIKYLQINTTPIPDKNYEMGTYQVTFDEYDLFCVDTKREKPKDEGWGRGNRPVINVSWEDASAYCMWLGQKTKKVYRLSTEEEWEYSCRAGTNTKWSFGDDKQELEKYAWYEKNSGGKIHPIGKKKPNSWGLYDMYGNVWEWCKDWYDNKKSQKILRGGSWNDVALITCCSVRYQADFKHRDSKVGFRFLRVLLYQTR